MPNDMAKSHHFIDNIPESNEILFYGGRNMTGWMKKSLVVAAAAAMTVGMTAIASAEDVTLEFQQWWGVELPD